MTKQFKADLALLLVTVVWGSTFVITKNVLKDIPTYNFLAIRFLTAFIFSSVVFYKSFFSLDKNTIKYGILIGIVLFIGFAFQTVGLNYTTASKSGFITGFSVVIVPLISAIMFRKLPSLSIIAGVVLAVIGLGLMTLDSSLVPNIGDFYTLIAAVFFALHIILVGKYTVNVNSINLAIIQIGVVGFSSLLFSLSTESFTIPSTVNTWGGILITSILATSGAFIVQNTMQKFTSATHTALIYTAEPVFSAIFAFMLIGERMTNKAIFGSILILLAMILGEIKLDFKTNRVKTES
ncbi:DMT family transporter [Brassicibacter mesophilus]|uniref:DMT family transporter n=1 Tax=Brassicibacter mesophilus TaxID=745119 RepID=UPI003D1EF963